MIYLAGPLFTIGERMFNETLAKRISERLGHGVFLPQKECTGSTDDTYRMCRGGLDGADIVVAVFDGPDADSGTCWEAGYAAARGIPVLGIRTDFRGCGDDGGFNLMISKSCAALLDVSSPDIDDPFERIVRFIGEHYQG